MVISGCCEINHHRGGNDGYAMFFMRENRFRQELAGSKILSELRDSPLL